jgi:hypothetical protein
MNAMRIPGRMVSGPRVSLAPLAFSSSQTLSMSGMRRACAGLRVARDIEEEDVGPAELQVDARLAALVGADHLGAEHRLEIAGHAFRVQREEMDVVEGVLRHDIVSLEER